MPNDAANSWLRWTEPRRHSNCAAFLRMPRSQGQMQSQSCVRHAITRSGIGSFGESRPVSRMVTGAMAGAVPQFGPVVDSLEPRDLPRALTNVGIASTRFWSGAGVSADAPHSDPPRQRLDRTGSRRSVHARAARPTSPRLQGSTHLAESCRVSRVSSTLQSPRTTFRCCR